MGVSRALAFLILLLGGACTARSLGWHDSDLGVPDIGGGPLPKACRASEDCGPKGTGNGLDDDCNGQVDDGCVCTPGDVERCFPGTPDQRGIGACTDGTQTCTTHKGGSWGTCTGAILPTPEICDTVDNDCNGLIDEGLTCDNTLTCPTEVPDVAPYVDTEYDSTAYFHGQAASWTWSAKGGPCDQLFLTTTGSPPAQSFKIHGAHFPQTTMAFTLSGDYRVTMEVVDQSGRTSACTWVQHVLGPGVRFELCWDTTGSTDLDLHVHRPNSTTSFFDASDGSDTSDDCNYRNCAATSPASDAPPDWGDPSSSLEQCIGGPHGQDWWSVGECRNPRLDMDNKSDVGGSENINIDDPHDGDTFRALVHYFNGGVLTHPLVNVYCGGRIKATYGQLPDVVDDFATSGQWANGDMWRVADVRAIVDGSGVTTDCDVTALHPAGSNAGYRVGHHGNLSYDGE